MTMWLAQLAEHRSQKPTVTGSTPVPHRECNNSLQRSAQAFRPTRPEDVGRTWDQPSVRFVRQATQQTRLAWPSGRRSVGLVATMNSRPTAARVCAMQRVDTAVRWSMVGDCGRRFAYAENKSLPANFSRRSSATDVAGLSVAPLRTV